MSTVTLADAQARLPELVRQLAPGEEIAITDGDDTVARLTANRPSRYARPLIRQWHWDAAPWMAGTGALGGGVFYWQGWNPLVGYAVGFGVALVLLTVVFTFARLEVSDAAE